ncbi:MAG: twin-arginine translocase subunit TatC [Selenomonadaceae bacterium]|nr:twin-arginine translocase subunit TatC [Selenomonadaceae bacterium]
MACGLQQFLGKYRRIIFFLSFVIGAIITPPDVISQVSLAVPVILLYETGYRIVKHILRK